MRARVLVVALLLWTVGCTPEKEDDLSPEQVAQIKKDVTAAVDTIVARFTRLDLEGTLAVYNDSPDFVLLGADGAKLDYAANKKAGQDFIASAASISVTQKSDECNVVTPELAICAWTGSEVVTLKSGDRMSYDPMAVTMVFRPVNGQWKVTYSHESGTMAMEKAAKK